jgi:hypothetical protein
LPRLSTFWKQVERGPPSGRKILELGGVAEHNAQAIGNCSRRSLPV